MSSKFIEYNFSAASACSTLCVDLYQELKYPFSYYQYVEINSCQLLTFLPTSSPIEKKCFLSNPIPYPEYLYKSTSMCFVNLTAPNNFLVSGNC